MTNQDVVYWYNGILFSLKETLVINKEEPWTHDAKWKKPDTFDSINMKFQNKQIHRDRVYLWLSGAGKVENDY